MYRRQHTSQSEDAVRRDLYSQWASTLYWYIMESIWLKEIRRQCCSVRRTCRETRWFIARSLNKPKGTYATHPHTRHTAPPEDSRLSDNLSFEHQQIYTEDHIASLTLPSNILQLQGEVPDVTRPPHAYASRPTHYLPVRECLCVCVCVCVMRQYPWISTPLCSRDIWSEKTLESAIAITSRSL